MAKIVVDSGCVYADDLRIQRGYNIEIVPLNMQIDEKSFIDNENLDLAGYINVMSESERIPKTSAPSPERYLQAYKGDESVFVVTLSSKLSGSNSSAEVAKHEYLKQNPKKFIHVFDSLSAGSAETVIAMKIQELIVKKLPDEEIVVQVEGFIKEMETIFILEKYDNFVKTGRINPVVAKVASMLSIKAICKGVDGKPEFFDKARGFNKGLKKLVDEIASQNKDFSNRNIVIMHVRDLEKAIMTKEEIYRRLDFKDIIISDATGLCATYAMENGIVVAY